MRCIVCSETALYRCSQCHIRWFCSRKCQQSDWITHKVGCAAKKILNQLTEVLDIEDMCKEMYYKDVKNTKECHCNSCANLCKVVPGNFSPLQFDLPNEHDSPTEKNTKQEALHQVFQSSLQHYYVNDDSSVPVVFFLRPQMVEENHAARLQIPKSTGTCVHLGKNGCTLQRNKMPIGCRAVLACDTKVKDSRYMGDLIEIAWKTTHGRNVMKAFEVYHQSKGVLTGSLDSTFVKDSNMYRVGLQLARQMATAAADVQTLLKNPSFVKTLSALREYSEIDQHIISNFAAFTYSIIVTRRQANS